MQIFDYRSSFSAPSSFPPSPLPVQRSVLSLGGFDGIHLGHRRLIQCVKQGIKQGIRQGAYQEKPPTGICLLDPLPFQVLRRGCSKDLPQRRACSKQEEGPAATKIFNRLFTIEETVEILEPLGLDFLCILPFSLEFSRLSPKQFVHSFLIKTFNPLKLVVGYDFKFAHKKQGDFVLLKKLLSERGVLVQRVEAMELKGEPVSSSRIRHHLSLGEVEQAKNLLGRAFSIKGKVKRGNAVGRKLGFPTANLHIEGKWLPKPGVYSGRAETGKGQWKAAIHIGQRPTLFAKDPSLLATPSLHSSSFLSIEAHLIGADSIDLYGEHLQLDLEHFVREEQAFSNLRALQSAIEQDIQKILSL